MCGLADGLDAEALGYPFRATHSLLYYLYFVLHYVYALYTLIYLRKVIIFMSQSPVSLSMETRDRGRERSKPVGSGTL